MCPAASGVLAERAVVRPSFGERTRQAGWVVRAASSRKAASVAEPGAAQ
jgi:hypothetical protein